ncbi:hypothetical protein, partial [Streptomyces sp. NPDC088183]|uniref:hypothetical protein n=1 Tax=Streptomyces sp. NPDC088183 TaxID=3160992 RepID=UPI0034394990
NVERAMIKRTSVATPVSHQSRQRRLIKPNFTSSTWSPLEACGSITMICTGVPCLSTAHYHLQSG